jgi:Bacteriophage CI repressor helix-turn-helix domain
LIAAERSERSAALHQKRTNVFQKVIRGCIKMQHGAFLRALFGRNATIARCNAPVKGVAVSGDVEEAISALRKRFRVQSDQGLADRLKLGRSTVTSWRRRGTVPDRYMRLATERPTALPDILDPALDPVERDAWVLALVRLTLGQGAKITDYPAFLQHGPFLPSQLAVGLEKALLDLSARMEESGLADPRQALNLIVFDDFFTPK